MSPDEVFAQLKTNSATNCNEAVRLLIKIAENIVKDPNNLKLRSLQKTNSTIKNKILSTKGGSECLKLMGFQETDTAFTMPATTPTDRIIEIKNCLLNLKANDQGAVPKQKVDIPSNTVIEDNVGFYELDNVKRFVLPPYTLKYTNPFLQRMETQFHNALAFDDKPCQTRAKKLIPLGTLETKAQRNLRYMQARIKKEKLIDPEFSFQDMLLLELLTWFKEDFFTWVDTPNCQKCDGKTAMTGMSTDAKDLVYTSKVEVYKCEICQQLTKFPRYNDLNLLLETRRGRCGEWAQVFTLLCRALGWDARYVIDELDHVWTEVYSVTQKRWVHCDPCENACDTPLMYETGWNKKLTYVIAYSPDEVQDVTWRYSCQHKDIIKRRRSCSENDLINALVSLRNERQKTFSASKRNYLTKRLVFELVELMSERKPNDNEKAGRVSGSAEWRLARGETKNENMYVWRIGDRHIINNVITIKYSAALDRYEFVKGGQSVTTVSEWNFGVYHFRSIFRKEEKDWKVVYLARSEGTDDGSISWRCELENDANKVIDSISLKFSHKTYENGVISIKLTSDDISLDFPQSQENLLTKAFSGKRFIVINANLSGGKGSVAWQHTQLFRQPIDDKDFPFVLSITFKDTT